jgi:hemerythrin
MTQHPSDLRHELGNSSPAEAIKPLVWTDDFCVGNDEIDAMHHEFVDLVRGLCEAPMPNVRASFEALGRHLASHFEQESALMRRFEYPVAQCHEDEHARVITSFREICDIEYGPTQQRVMREFGLALRDWFPAHTTYLDSPLSHWISSRRFGGKPVVIRTRADLNG